MMKQYLLFALTIGFGLLFLHQYTFRAMYQMAFEDARASMESYSRTHKGRINPAFVCRKISSIKERH